LSTGLKRTGINISVVPPGKESFVYHSQLTEEEWIYLLSGKSIAQIENEEYEVEAGDFMGFPCGVAHHMRNECDQDLVYLVGGENHEFDVADFPEHGRRLVKMGDKIELYEKSDAKDFWNLKKAGE
jgi:uncharacterized cupin superfamily protein